MVQNFALFVDGLATMKIKTAKVAIATNAFEMVDATMLMWVWS